MPVNPDYKSTSSYEGSLPSYTDGESSSVYGGPQPSYGQDHPGSHLSYVSSQQLQGGSYASAPSYMTPSTSMQSGPYQPPNQTFQVPAGFVKHPNEDIVWPAESTKIPEMISEIRLAENRKCLKCHQLRYMPVGADDGICKDWEGHLQRTELGISFLMEQPINRGKVITLKHWDDFCDRKQHEVIERRGDDKYEELKTLKTGKYHIRNKNKVMKLLGELSKT